MSFANLNALWAHALIDTLVANGVGRVVISPGSRSTPIAIAAAAHPRIQPHVLVDERSAGFFALGLARGGAGPVALVCTSGTAAANYHPAIVEASQAHVPLVVLSADRPARLRHLGSPQTIDQTRLYGAAVRRFIELPEPMPSVAAIRQMAAQVALAVGAACLAPLGPVHLNVPLDEPLAPVPHQAELVAALAAGMPPAPRLAPGRLVADESALDELAARVAAAARPLIVAGPGIEAAGDALLAWAEAWALPVVADIGADLRARRSAAPLLVWADAYLRAEAFRRSPPDLVVRVGGAPTGKGVLGHLADARPPAVGLQPDADGRDPEAIAEWVVVGDVADACARLADRPAPAPRPDWLGFLQQAEQATGAILAAPATPVPQEARALAAAAGCLPAGAVLALSNSLPIRHADTYLGRGPVGVRTVVFRGANGIDGVTSMSLGVAVASGAPTLLVTGDLAFLHDLGGLAAARELAGPMVVLVLNNDGGGIFSYLPVAGSTPDFEALFGTPHGLTLAHAATLHRLPHTLAASPRAVGEAVAAGLSGSGLSIVEFQSDRAATAADHQACMARVRAAIGEAAACPL